MNQVSLINTENFQSLIDNYESAIKEITTELDQHYVEQAKLRNNFSILLQENAQLGTQIAALLTEKNNKSTNTELTDLKFKDNDYIENLKDQLQTVIDEKEHAIKLWQNATQTVEFLEDQLKIYQDITQGLVPRSELFRVKSLYEEKIKSLETSLAQAKQNQSVNITEFTKVNKNQEKEDNKSFEIIKNLEDEVLKLQKRLKQNEQAKNVIENNLEIKISAIDNLKSKNRECILKVEEALRVVEAALNEKDAALIRENEAKDKVAQLSKALDEIIVASENKIINDVKGIKSEYERKLKRIADDLHNAQADLKLKSVELEGLSNERAVLRHEIERFKKGKFNFDDTSTSKMLILEKNLENTFQKLLVSEKQNIQLKSENESIRNDQEQMASYYERDVKSREAEKIVLKKDITKLQTDIKESRIQLENQLEFIGDLELKLEETEKRHQEDLEELRNSHTKKMNEITNSLDSNTKELVGQLISQVEFNKKWRDETKIIIESLERRLLDMKSEIGKLKSENKSLSDKLKAANSKIYEYKKFLQIISNDVNKITHIALPEKNKESR